MPDLVEDKVFDDWTQMADSCNSLVVVTFMLFLICEELPKNKDFTFRQAEVDKAREDLRKTGRVIPAVFEPVLKSLCEGDAGAGTAA